jgi:hypothetical protein
MNWSKEQAMFWSGAMIQGARFGHPLLQTGISLALLRRGTDSHRFHEHFRHRFAGNLEILAIPPEQ